MSGRISRPRSATRRAIPAASNLIPFPAVFHKRRNGGDPPSVPLSKAFCDFAAKHDLSPQYLAQAYFKAILANPPKKIVLTGDAV